MAFVVDYSSARPDPEALRQVGYVAAMRYLGSDSRCITPTELQALQGAGLKVGLIWETAATRVLGGWDAGVSDGPVAAQWAARLEAPSWVPIFGVAVDFDATAAQLVNQVTAYAKGFAQTCGHPAGAYGNDRAIDVLVGGGVVPYGWQCAAWSMGGTGTGGTIRTGYPQPVRLSAHAHLFQHYGMERIAPPGSTDHNETLKPAPLWWGSGQTQPDGDDEMTEDDWVRMGQLFVDQDTRMRFVLPTAIGENVQWRLTNGTVGTSGLYEAGTAPVTMMDDGKGGQYGATITQAILLLQSLDPAQLEAIIGPLTEVVSHLEQGNAPSAEAVAKELLDQLGALIAPARGTTEQ